MLDAAHAGELDVLISAGGNFLEVMPDPDWVREALGRVPLRVHMDIVVSTQMLVDPAQDVLLLPMTTRYESPGGVTETTTERRVIFSPEIEGHRIGEARPEWRVFGELAASARPELAEAGFADAQSIREEIASVVPGYEQLAGLRERGDQFQIGGARLCEGPSFPLPGGRARFQTRVAARPGARRRAPAALHAARQAVQLDGPVEPRRADRRGALGRADQRRRRRSGSASRDGARGDRAQRPRRAARAARASARSAPATCRSTGPRATC